MSEVVYRSEVRIERVKGPVRKAYLPANGFRAMPSPVALRWHGPPIPVPSRSNRNRPPFGGPWFSSPTPYLPNLGRRPGVE